MMMSIEYVIEELEWLIANNDWVENPEGTQDQNSINALKEAIELLTKQNKLLEHLNMMEKKEKNYIASTLFGALIGTCKVKDILQEDSKR